MQDEKYDEFYRKAEEKFFEDLKHYRTVVSAEDVLSSKQLRQYTEIKAIINKRLKEELLSKEQIKSYEYAKARIKYEKERAQKKDKIFFDLVKYVCEDGKILIEWSGLLNKQMDIVDKALPKHKIEYWKLRKETEDLKVPEPFVLGGSFHSNRAKRLRSLEQIKYVADWGTLELMQEYDEFIRSVPLEKWRRGISDGFESTLGVPINDAGEIELDEDE